MYYICENDKPNKWYQLFIRVLNIVKIEKNEIIIPQIPKLKLIEKNRQSIEKRASIKKREKFIKKISKKTVNLLNKTNCNKIVLSKQLKKEEKFVNYLYSKNLEIVDGRFLFLLLAPEIIKYIITKKQINEQKLRIAILVNDLNQIITENIKMIAETCKNITIVTRHINRLRRLQKNLYDNKGIVIAVSNNKRRALSRSNIILNFDFPEEIINKYTINEKANIINFRNKIKIYKKRFNGINVNDYEIKLKEDKIKEMVSYNEKIVQDNYLKDIYEGQFYKNQNIKELRKKIQEDKVQILYLIGNKTIY